MYVSLCMMTQYAFLTCVHMCLCVLSGIQIWLQGCSNVSYSYFIRESGKLWVSRLAWDETPLETNQDSHLQTLLMLVGGEREKEWVYVCMRLHMCMHKIKCVYGSEARDWIQQKQRKHELKIDLCGKRLLYMIPRCMCMYGHANVYLWY